MRIVHLGKYYPPAPGGIESHVQTLAIGQAELGHEVRVICVNHADEKGKDLTHSRWRSTYTREELDGKVNVIRVARWFSVSRLEVCPRLLSIVKNASRKCDVVHLHTPNPLMMIAWWLAGDRSVPLFVTHHSDVVKQKILMLAVMPVEKSVYSKAKSIFTTSPKYLVGSTQLERFASKVKTLSMGIDLSPYLKMENDLKDEIRRFTSEFGWPIWLMVGRLTYYKGYQVALKALTNVPGRLVIVGSGPMERELKSQAERFGVGDRVTWYSSVSQEKLIALYHAATALWFPSIARSEGFGLVQVEAMACGCPVINTHISGSGVSWVSQDGVSGYTVKVGDSEGLAKAACFLAENKNHCVTLGINAKARARTEFDAKLMVDKSISYYKQFR